MYLKSLLITFNLKITISHFELNYTMRCSTIYGTWFKIPGFSPLFLQTALTEN